MTVGELVEAKWQEKVVAEDMIRLSAGVPSLNALAILRNLGIWDAEVHDAVIHPTLDGLSTCLLFENGVAATFTETYTGKPGKLTKVVCLLPPEEVK